MSDGKPPVPAPLTAMSRAIAQAIEDTVPAAEAPARAPFRWVQSVGITMAGDQEWILEVTVPRPGNAEDSPSPQELADLHAQLAAMLPDEHRAALRIRTAGPVEARRPEESTPGEVKG